MTIRMTVDGAIASLILDRPHKLNALDIQTFGQLDQCITDIAHADPVRAVVIGAAGARAFCAGADIGDLLGLSVEEAHDRAAFRRQVLQRLADLPVPSIAAIDGLTLGGGVELALACTFRVASPRSTFGLPEIKLGLLPGAGGTQRLPRCIGKTRALELMLTARPLDADAALAIGLIEHIADDPLRCASELARSWLDFSKPALTAILSAVRCSDLPLDAGLAAEGAQLAAVSGGQDAAEGIRAFLEKRAPRFNMA